MPGALLNFPTTSLLPSVPNLRSMENILAKTKQEDYMRALAFKLLLLEPRQAKIFELIEAADCYLGTCFFSTLILLPVLAINVWSDIAFSLLLQKSPLSWPYQVERSATTIWEPLCHYHCGDTIWVGQKLL